MGAYTVKETERSVKPWPMARWDRYPGHPPVCINIVWTTIPKTIC
jgi:hypothetical protein